MPILDPAALADALLLGVATLVAALFVLSVTIHLVSTWW